jgi:hypothetical protein
MHGFVSAQGGKEISWQLGSWANFEHMSTNWLGKIPPKKNVRKNVQKAQMPFLSHSFFVVFGTKCGHSAFWSICEQRWGSDHFLDEGRNRGGGWSGLHPVMKNKFFAEDQLVDFTCSQCAAFCQWKKIKNKWKHWDEAIYSKSPKCPKITRIPFLLHSNTFWWKA